ncbi:YchJ family protein [Kineosporia sp. R_H_3]|uniref:YchJ family protein n=1 Tax=Kineosporia sp. R_H_3 TaxID=1961848 RepID=UPI000B4A9307|nr:YchJ family metal-binding protein [Kineosporia sp. R_H_3]
MDTAAPRDDDAPCPCGRGGSFGALTFARCCGRWTGPGAPPAPDAESLMRSRYSAYVRGDVAHVSATWDPLTRPAGPDLDGGPTWLGLQVLDAGDDGVEQGRPVAHVEFVATYRGSDGRVHRMHERSRFTRRGERWFYVDGEVT